MRTEMTDRERAAAFVRGASPEEMERVLAHLSPADRQRLVREADALDLPIAACRAIVEEVLRAASGPAPGPPTPRLPFAGWQLVDVANFLEAQHPQMVVCLLARMEPGAARATMDALCGATRLEVLERLQAMARMEASDGNVREDLVSLLLEAVREIPPPFPSLFVPTGAEQSPDDGRVPCRSSR